MGNLHLVNCGPMERATAHALSILASGLATPRFRALSGRVFMQYIIVYRVVK